MAQFLFTTKLGQFIVGTGWLGILAAGGWWIYHGEISTTMLVGAATAVLSGGGVHFIYTRNNGHSNGASGGATNVPTQPGA